MIRWLRCEAGSCWRLWSRRSQQQALAPCERSRSGGQQLQAQGTGCRSQTCPQAAAGQGWPQRLQVPAECQRLALTPAQRAARLLRRQRSHLLVVIKLEAGAVGPPYPAQLPVPAKAVASGEMYKVAGETVNTCNRIATTLLPPFNCMRTRSHKWASPILQLNKNTDLR